MDTFGKALAAVPSPIESFVGSFTAHVTKTLGGRLVVKIENQTSVTSLTRYVQKLGASPLMSWDRSASGWGTPGGNTNQTYTWMETSPCM